MIFYSQIRRKVPKFEVFLTANGAQVLRPTNEWEVARFIAGGETGIVYRNKRDEVSFVGPAEGAFSAFRSGQPWRVDQKNGKALRSKPVAATIRARDGDECFYCALAVSIEDESVEHLVARAHDGPNHISSDAARKQEREGSRRRRRRGHVLRRPRCRRCRLHRRRGQHHRPLLGPLRRPRRRRRLRHRR